MRQIAVTRPLTEMQVSVHSTCQLNTTQCSHGKLVRKEAGLSAEPSV